MEDPRPWGAAKGFGALLLASGRIPFWLAQRRRSTTARRQERAFFAAIIRGFGVSVAPCGTRAVAGPVLYVANHISWMDIPVLASLLDADFVAKSDIADWPLMGRLSRHLDPVFVSRGQRHGSRDQAESVRRRLRDGRSVILFPEGTTSDGRGLLPFRTALFEAADAAAAVQPVALGYTRPCGRRLSEARQREVAWIDDDELLGGAARFARQHSCAQVAFLDPLDPAGHANRKALAAAARLAIEGAYAALLNRPR